MATYGDLKNFTYGELSQMGLTHGDLKDLSYEELLTIAKDKLERFKNLPDDFPVTNEANQQIQQIYQTAKSEIPTLNVAPQTKWSKQPTEIMFEAICMALASGAVAQLPHLIALIISAIDQLIK
ncbi:hypothetical protein [Caproiciproducens galactitolivorans]|uniref:Uncharacterized protein n=1 Tax=Caproiciproducens galactitolivorans TaxID=642589 RepID=A0ABT4BZ37_9FIRM|nr:hypothetical protein [Caproiciproducens galactitolivorans]MCY1715313.1 hypothetical protein [Caproiciproducens galactitolivorans]